MRIAFFTEGNSGAPLPLQRNHINCRTDIAWKIALKSHNYGFDSFVDAEYDLGIIIVPKVNPVHCFEKYDNYKSRCRKWAVMQEGPHNYWQGWSVDVQIQYIQFLNKMDIIFCHNEYDRRYYLGLFENKDVRVMSSLMIDDSIPKDIITRKEHRSGVMIGGNWVEWYGGADSFFISREFGNEQRYAPSMGRKQEYEDYLEDIKYLPYLNWSDWIIELSKRKYAIHLMRTYAAGTFQLNCAYLGIPCIGWNVTDTQKICFPELCADQGDMYKIRKIAKHLYSNEQFYDHVSEYAKRMYHEHFHETVFLKKFYSEM